MRIVIQDRRSNAFLTSELRWNPQPRFAREFPTSLEALRFCVERELTGMDVLVSYPHGKAGIRVPLC